MRSRPVTTSLAIRESKAPGMVSPARYPPSRRTPGPLGGAQRGEGAGGGHEVAPAVLGVDPELDGVPAHLGVVVAELLAGRDPEHLPDQVDAGDLLGDAVLDLQAGVHLEERDGAVAGHEELAGAGADVPGLAQDRLGGLVELGHLLVGEERRGRLLDQLLVPALQRAVAGGDDHDVAVGVGQALGLDVARPVEELLHEALAATEGGDGLADRGLERVGDLGHLAGDLEAAAAAAERRLDRDRQAVLLGEGHRLVGVRERVLGAGRQRGADLLGDVAGPHLVAEALDGGRRRPDPDQAGVDHGLGEGGVLGEEAVAGVHRIGARRARDGDDLVDVEVGVGGGGAVEGVRLVGDPHELRVAVGVGVDRHARDPGVLAGADDPHRDLAAVGDEDLLQWLAVRHVVSWVGRYLRCAGYRLRRAAGGQVSRDPCAVGERLLP